MLRPSPASQISKQEDHLYLEGGPRLVGLHPTRLYSMPQNDVYSYVYLDEAALIQHQCFQCRLSYAAITPTQNHYLAPRSMRALPPLCRCGRQPWRRLNPASVFYRKVPEYGSTPILSFTFTFEVKNCGYEFAYTIPWSYTEVC